MYQNTGFRARVTTILTLFAIGLTACGTAVKSSEGQMFLVPKENIYLTTVAGDTTTHQAGKPPEGCWIGKGSKAKEISKEKTPSGEYYQVQVGRGSKECFGYGPIKDFVLGSGQ